MKFHRYCPLPGSTMLLPPLTAIALSHRYCPLPLKKSFRRPGLGCVGDDVRRKTHVTVCAANPPCCAMCSVILRSSTRSAAARLVSACWTNIQCHAKCSRRAVDRMENCRNSLVWWNVLFCEVKVQDEVKHAKFQKEFIQILMRQLCSVSVYVSVGDPALGLYESGEGHS